jgi:hypothetical protein
VDEPQIGVETVVGVTIGVVGTIPTTTVTPKVDVTPLLTIVMEYDPLGCVDAGVVAIIAVVPVTLQL